MNYREVQQAISENRPFKHQHSMSGHREVLNGDDLYVVYSYQTKIFTENITRGERIFNDRKHSQTTNRQQSLIRRAKAVA